MDSKFKIDENKKYTEFVKRAEYLGFTDDQADFLHENISEQEWRLDKFHRILELLTEKVKKLVELKKQPPMRECCGEKECEHNFTEGMIYNMCSYCGEVAPEEEADPQSEPTPQKECNTCTSKKPELESHAFDDIKLPPKVDCSFIMVTKNKVAEEPTEGWEIRGFNEELARGLISVLRESFAPKKECCGEKKCVHDIQGGMYEEVCGKCGMKYEHIYPQPEPKTKEKPGDDILDGIAIENIWCGDRVEFNIKNGHTALKRGESENQEPKTNWEDYYEKTNGWIDDAVDLGWDTRYDQKEFIKKKIKDVKSQLLSDIEKWAGGVTQTFNKIPADELFKFLDSLK